MRTFMLTTLMLLALLLVACGGGEPAADVAEEEPTAETASPTEATEEEGQPGENLATEEPESTTEPAPASEETAQEGGSMLQKVKDRGQLNCGVTANLAGFGNLGSDGEHSGFDSDFCRVIAAAVLGDAEAIEFRVLSDQERFTAVQTGEVDILIMNTTNTISRETSVGLDFGPTTFYDGQGMIVRKDSDIETLEDMDGADICVTQGTTTELNLADQFRALDIEFTAITINDDDQIRQAYDSGQCDGYTTDKSGLISQQTQLNNPDEHKILALTMSKEPLAPSVLQGDAQWRDIMNWAVYATFQAEEFGITQDNLDEMLKSDDPNIARFLGQEGTLGEDLGLDNDFVVNIIKAVGNYGEIFDRNLGPDTPFNLPRGLNEQYYNGGLIYSPPFR